MLHFVWPNPLRGSWLSFAIWSITSHFLYSFQGVFVASVYFLFDDKVRMRKIITKMHLWLISNFRFSSDLLNLFQVKDTLYKFWVLKVRLRDWGFSNSVNNPSRPGSIHAPNCRVFEPSNLDSERSECSLVKVEQLCFIDTNSLFLLILKFPWEVYEWATTVLISIRHKVVSKRRQIHLIH